MLEFIDETIQPEFVMWGGDSASHDAATQSFNETVSELEGVSNAVISGLKDYQIYATIGNHDAFPQDMIQATPKFNDAIRVWSRTWDPLFADEK